MIQKYTILNEMINSHIDQLEGGLADRYTPSKYNQRELAMGIEVEKEHTPNPDIAREIAMDHLEEIPDYYTRLKKMEDEAESEDLHEGIINSSKSMIKRFANRSKIAKQTDILNYFKRSLKRAKELGEDPNRINRLSALVDVHKMKLASMT